MPYLQGMGLTAGMRQEISKFQYVHRSPVKVFGVFDTPDWKVEKAVFRNQFSTTSSLIATQQIDYFQMPEQIAYDRPDSVISKTGEIQISLSNAAVRILELTNNYEILDRLGIHYT